MKALLLILILYISHISCDDINKMSKDLLKKSKKVKLSQIYLYNSEKSINKNKLFKPIFKVKTKKTNDPKDFATYTAFPSVNEVEKEIDVVPDSPYFPLPKNDEAKLVFGKIIPQTKVLTRRKRSVIASNGTKTVKKTSSHVLAKNDSHVKPKIKKRSTNSHIKEETKKRRKPQKLNTVRNKLQAQKANKKKSNATRLSRSKKSKGTRIELVYNEKSGKSKKLRKNKSIRSGKVSKLKNSKKLKNGTNSHKIKRGKVDARRLIAGRDATIEEFPYVVSIQKNHQHWCTGALLNPRIVITTANCLWKSSRISRLRIRAGSRNVNRGGQTAGIQEVMKHPGWGIRRDPDNDLALVLLDKRIRFTDMVHAADLPNRDMMPTFEDAWIASWGADRRDGVYDNKDVSLQAYHARLIDRPKCNNMTQRFGVSVTENFICLAQTGRRAPCTRDTGAPAVSDGVIWGLASWGIRKLCGTERFPAMFSYIASKSNMDFITNATHYLMSDERHYPFPGRIP